MIDPDLKKELDLINDNLVKIRKSGGVWKSFGRGILSGLGYIIGIAIALALIGWFLNSIGVIPAFKEQANSWKQTLDDIRRMR